MSAEPSTAGPFTATGEFEVRIEPPIAVNVPSAASPLGRRTLEKNYHGALSGRASGEMLTSGDMQTGEATYIALESFIGTLDGREGGFTLRHFGQMHAGQQALSISITPGSGSGLLVGIEGELLIRCEGGKHYYTLNYRLG
ncbi:DUF3224 domain-containing protein [Pseudomonas sp. RIT-PI-S]|uniref:DUF3224 domain-containing protein n=1 Tax=Pseudomonas sp. RIT-PI-S TaxID=3035295 RepID=UPI0021D91B51|nr:DUF3224 domain-containing protein [Pseudomonas sp. RIT-PI-S]